MCLTALRRLCLPACLIAACLIAPLGLPPPAAAQSAELDGDWLGFPMTAILMGAMVPVHEHLRIDGARAESRGWAIPMTAARCGGPSRPPVCTPPVAIGAARIERPDEGRPDRLRFLAEGPQINPMTHPTDAAVWPLMALAGFDWLARGGDRMLILSREAVIEGEPVTLERVYLRAGPDTAGHVFDYLRATNVSLGRSVCALLALHDEPENWDAFVSRIGIMAPVTAELRRLFDLGERSRDEILRMATLRHGPETLAVQAADVSDLPETARTAWMALQAQLPLPGDEGDDLLNLAALSLSPPDRVLARTRACLDYVFGH